MKTRLSELISARTEELPENGELKIFDPHGDTKSLITVLQNQAESQGKSVRFVPATGMEDILN